MEFVVENEHGRFEIVKDEKYGFWKVSPPPAEEFLSSFYSQQYQCPSPSFHDELYVDLIKRRAPDVYGQKARVLEIGCGNGDKLVAFKAEGFETYGFEPGTADYDLCTSKGLFVFNQPFDPGLAKSHGPYSIIVLANILEHLPHPEEMLEQVHPILDSSGLLLIEVPNEFNAFQEVFLSKTNERRWFFSPPDHLNYFTPTSLSQLLTDKGWAPRHWTTRFPMELFLLMGRNYVGEPTLGRAAHLERVEFEKSFLGGNEEILWRFYEALAKVELGREIIVICEKDGFH